MRLAFLIRLLVEAFRANEGRFEELGDIAGGIGFGAFQKERRRVARRMRCMLCGSGGGEDISDRSGDLTLSFGSGLKSNGVVPSTDTSGDNGCTEGVA